MNQFITSLIIGVAIIVIASLIIYIVRQFRQIYPSLIPLLPGEQRLKKTTGRVKDFFKALFSQKISRGLLEKWFKGGPRVRIASSDFAVSLLTTVIALFILGLVFGIIVLLGMGVIRCISVVLRHPVDSLAAALIILGFTYFFFRYRKTDEDKEDKNKGKRAQVWFAFTWTIVMFILNVILWHLDSQWWLDLRNYKDSTSLFWFVMVVLTVSVWVLANVKDSKLKFCGFVAMAIACAAWGTIIFSDTRVLQAGRWTKFEIPFGKEIKVHTEYGIPFEVMANNDPSTRRESGPNGEWVQLPRMKISSLSFKPSMDTRARIEYLDARP